MLLHNVAINGVEKRVSDIIMVFPAGRVFRPYCTGLSHKAGMRYISNGDSPRHRYACRPSLPQAGKRVKMLFFKFFKKK
jgi:hypothetical protein